MQVPIHREKLRLIAGSGRSGTTWVLDTIADANRLRPIFEPLHPDCSLVAHRFAYSYLTKESVNDELKAFFTSITNNQLRSIWTSYRIRPIRLRLAKSHFTSPSELKSLANKWKTLARRYWAYRTRESWDKVVVKCIRANLMLEWIHANFDARTVLLMRHPCATVESQLRFPEHWDPYGLVIRYRHDQALRVGPLRGRAGILDDNLSRAQALTAIWCVENLVPALQAAANRYQVVFYEELLERPELEWPRIAEGLGVSAVPDRERLQQPSQQAAIRLQKQQDREGIYKQNYSGWRARLTTEEISEIESVLRAFRIGFYTIAENRPDVESFSREFLHADSQRRTSQKVSD